MAGLAFVVVLFPAGGVASTGCSSPAGAAACAGLPTAPFVTVAQAKAAIVALWEARERAQSTRNLALFAGVETGTQLTASDFAVASAECGCSTYYWTKGERTVRAVTVFVPRFESYPLYFMAEVTAALPGVSVPSVDPGVTALLIVTRLSPWDPWRVATQVYDGGYGPRADAFQLPSTDPSGYDVSVGAAARVARTWPSLLVDYYNHMKLTGKAPADTAFAPGPLTTQSGYGARRNGYTNHGQVAHYRFVMGGLGAPWLFTVGPMVFSCADILEYETVTWATIGHEFIQLPSHGSGSDWGQGLDPGVYSELVDTYELPACVYQYDGDKLWVYGPDGGSYTIHVGGIPQAALPGSVHYA